jgi:hypothetical protein
MKNIEYYRKQPISENPQQDFGAPSKEEYDRWFPNVCSICCLKSIGDYFEVTRDKSLYQLTMDALATGVFKEDEETGEILGAYHVPLVQLAESLGLHGKVERRLTLRRLINLLNDGSLVMLSVDKSKIDSKLNGGHLILIHSYDAKSETFIVHDSEPVLADDGENVQVGKKQLEQISNQRGISLRKLS